MLLLVSTEEVSDTTMLGRITTAEKKYFPQKRRLQFL